MDNNTPERSQIGTRKPKFEDSPIFNYINSLSPIKPMKSSHVTHSLNSLSFTSIPSVFTSPHVTAHKDSSFLRRHHVSDPTKPLVSSEKNGVDGNEKNSHAIQTCQDASSFVPLNERLKLVTLPQTLRYDCGSPGRESTSHCDITADSVLPLAESSTKLVPFNLIVSEKGTHVGEGDLSGTCTTEQKEGGTECEWENLISETPELVNFYPPHETETFEEVILSSQNQEKVNDLDDSQLGDPLHTYVTHKTTDPSTQPEEVSKLSDIGQKLDENDSISTRLGPATNSRQETNNEPVTNLQRGVRRRCLVFEMGGARIKNFVSCSTSNSSMLLQPGEDMVIIDNQPVSIKPVGKSSLRTLPGIGLHLNALAQTPNNIKAVEHDTLTTGGQSDVSNNTEFHSPITGEETVNNKLVPASTERDTNLNGNDIQGDENALQAPTDLHCEDSEQISPKKKRRRVEQVGENDGCKRCNCKKSKCLKLYCECFAASVYCIGPCSCQDCFNKPVHEETVLATRKQIELRNPLAFAPKVVRTSDPLPDTRSQDEAIQTPASARHKRGCNCKKSSCLKKYCECYQSGVGCSINCRCEGCKNAFGTKDGFCIVETVVEPDEEETEKFEKNVVNKDLRIPQIPNKEDHTADSPLPSTPLLISRVSTQLPFPPKNKLQRSFTIGPSPGLQNPPILTPNFLQPPPKIDRNIRTIPKENYLPVVLQTNSTPISGVKSSSPNSKRVSPPQSDFESSSSTSSSPSLKSSRKLILQSIPSFPCLNSQP